MTRQHGIAKFRKGHEHDTEPTVFKTPRAARATSSYLWITVFFWHAYVCKSHHQAAAEGSVAGRVHATVHAGGDQSHVATPRVFR